VCGFEVAEPIARESGRRIGAKEYVMTINLLTVRLAGLALATCMFGAAANAQVTIEMRKIKCSQYLAMGPVESEAFSAWMSGWYNYQIRTTWVDLLEYQKNVANVKDWCKYHPNETVMSGLDKATAGR
jgi:hypothetical protein